MDEGVTLQAVRWRAGEPAIAAPSAPAPRLLVKPASRRQRRTAKRSLQSRLLTRFIVFWILQRLIIGWLWRKWLHRRQAAA